MKWALNPACKSKKKITNPKKTLKIPKFLNLDSKRRISF